MTKPGVHVFGTTCRAAVLALALTATLAPQATAQEGGLFAPRVTVNGQVVSNFELEQRVLFLRALRAPGDPADEAMRGLIEDRLSQQAAKKDGITVSAEEISAGMAEFAARANLSAEDFAAALAQEGVAPETFRDFVEAGLLWRAVVRARFGGTVSASTVQIERAAANTARKPEIRVLISELILPADPANAAAALDAARDIKAGIGAGGFAAAARQYSASPSAAQGGRLDWMELSNLPPAIAQRLLALAPGEVSDPVALPQAVALFQLNTLSETETISPAAVHVAWAEYLPEAGETADGLRARLDDCGDLNLAAKGRGAEALTLRDGTMDRVPASTGLALAQLDPGEGVMLASGGREVFVMLCTREALPETQTETQDADAAEPVAADGAATDGAADGAALEGAAADGADAAPAGPVLQDRAAIRAGLLNQEIALKAAGLMEEMRSEAIITTP